MPSRFTQPLLSLPRSIKQFLALTLDATLCALSVWIAFGLRVDAWTGFGLKQWWALAWTVALALPIFYLSGLYRGLFRFESSMSLVRACGLFGLVHALLFTIVGVPEVLPRSLGVLIPALLFLTAGAARVALRYAFSTIPVSRPAEDRLPQALVYGAGSAGHQVVAALARSRQMKVRAFIDDSPSLKGATLLGLPIFPSSKFGELVRKHSITDILLAIPSVSAARRAQIVASIHALHLPLHVRTLPDLSDIAQGKVQIDHVRELDVEELLGRAPVAPDQDLLARKITGKVVLVTGAGGSIGSELCRQIVRLQPAALVIVELSEFALYAIDQELRILSASSGFPLVPILASVRDEAQMRKVLVMWQPDTIYHAAAYKHVPLVEHNPGEGIKNNALGTITIARLAAEQRVKDFVLISTDKAVRPTNVMGASKRLAEMVLQALHDEGCQTRFSMVRFGNVLGSSGSVVPLFRRQIREGGPITITHPEITRYFMTIPEAAQLVIQASAMATGGEVFLLDMGAPVRIVDLARRMVELSGLTIRDEANPHGDIALAVTGLRPGEKLYEELLIGDNPRPTAHPRVMKAHEECLAWPDLCFSLDRLTLALAEGNAESIKRELRALVPGYQPAATQPVRLTSGFFDGQPAGDAVLNNSLVQPAHAV
jgi:FlaA1/EpsC-like NDP-sugar epimerase